MKKYIKILLLIIIGQLSFANVQQTTYSEVLNLASRVATSHLLNPRENTSLIDWPIAPYYDGLIALSQAMGNPVFWSEVIRCGDSVAWTNAMRPYHADDIAVSHSWLKTYQANKTKTERFVYVKERLDKIIEDASTWTKGEARGFGNSPVYSWNWCDALYMAPITFLRMYNITGDKKYLDYMNQEFKWTTDRLYSKEDSLFYRDARFIGKINENGKKIFWGRGNGWVIAGLAMILEEYPKADKGYQFYKELFLQMANAVRKSQLENGLWGVNLADKNEYKNDITLGGEGSSSAFITFALAWGVNNGLLDGSYRNVVLKGWDGLKSLVDEKGRFCYVQPIGASPDSFSKDTTQVYGVGAFFLTASEVSKILGNKIRVSDAELVRRAECLNEAKIPSAEVRFEPRRKQDVAWENSKVAHRVYGPELRDSIENSGIDIFSKTVGYNITKKWYDEWVRIGWSYHTDKGEGCDLFKVADTVGCGGTGIFHNGKLYKANVYRSAHVILAPVGQGKLGLTYYYDIDGRKITEIKILSINATDNFTKSHSYFVRGHRKFIVDWCYSMESVLRDIKKAAVNDIVVATGLYTQSKNAKVETSKKGEIIVDDIQEGKVPIKMFVKAFSNVEGTKTIEHKNRHKEVLVLMKPSKTGEVKHIFGYELK